jgi:hypothetical protein
MPVEHAYGAHDAVPNSRLKIMDGVASSLSYSSQQCLSGSSGTSCLGARRLPAARDRSKKR